MFGHFDAKVVIGSGSGDSGHAEDEVIGSPGGDSLRPLLNGKVSSENKNTTDVSHCSSIPIPIYLPNSIAISNLIKCKFRHMPNHQSSMNNNNNNNQNITNNNNNNNNNNHTYNKQLLVCNLFYLVCVLQVGVCCMCGCCCCL